MWGAIKKSINSNLNKSLDVLIQEKATETNNKVDTKASQMSINTLQNTLNAVNNLLGTKANQSSLDNLQSILNNVNSSVGVLANSGMVKSVQRGVVMTTTDKMTNVSINPVNLNKSIVTLDFGLFYANRNNIFTIRLVSQNSIEIFTTLGYVSTPWQVIEFY